MDALDDEILQLFVEESREHLDGIEDDLLAIEQMGEDLDSELVDGVFRALHSIKGGAGFFDLVKLQDLAHAMENILDLVRKRTLVVTKNITSKLLAGADTLNGMIGNLETSNDQDISEHLASFRTILDAATDQDDDAPAENTAQKGSSDTQEEQDPVTESSDELPLPQETPASAENPATQSNKKPAKSKAPKTEKKESAGVGAKANIAAAGKSTGTVAQSAAKPGKSVDRSIRVQLPLLDRLMELAGELVLTRNALLQSTASGDKSLIQTAAQKVDAITSQLQEAIMSTRMQSIDIVFSKFKRIVRDLSSQLGKKIDLKIIGEDVDLDKTIIEALGDPMTHLVRNAVDHGLETPAKRKAAGKPEEGLLKLHAFHEAGQVVIEIRDDGAGIDAAVISRKALEKGLCTEEELSRMTEKDIIRLIFKPGFSTVEEVTDISGRGVGMDVVRKNLGKVGGVADIESELGHGSVIRIKLPLTLAIIPSVLIGVNEERYAIPQVNVVEMVRITPGEVQNRIEHLGDVVVLRLRGELLPLVELTDFLGVEGTFICPDSGERKKDQRERLVDRRGLQGAPDEPIKNCRSNHERRESYSSAVNIVIVASGAFKYGIRVDELCDSAEIVVKPLGMHFRGNREYAGATILGDGRVAFILDIEGIRDLAGVNESQGPLDLEEGLEKQRLQEADSCSLLIMRHAAEEFYAIPLQLVSRIEKFDWVQLQTLGESKAISYRGGILPLISLDGMVSSIALDKKDDFYIIVFNVGTREVGLMASDIRDIVNISAAVDGATHKRPGISGSVILDGSILQYLDLWGLLELDDPGWTQHLSSKPEGGDQTLLIVEDSPFFMTQMSEAVKAAGFKVLQATDGIEGITQLESHPEIAMILTDIEMPNMNGFQMVRAIRRNPEYKNLPIAAVTSLAGSAAEREGYDAGVNEYMIKLDRQQLVESCRRLLKAAGKVST